MITNIARALKRRAASLTPVGMIVGSGASSFAQTTPSTDPASALTTASTIYTTVQGIVVDVLVFGIAVYFVAKVMRRGK
jgi:hypothetical protein